MRLFFLLLSLLVFTAEARLTEAKTFRLILKEWIYDTPDGRHLFRWEQGTPLTSNEEIKGWIKITGYFPDDQWQSTKEESWWIRKSALQEITPPRYDRPGQGVYRYVVVDKANFALAVIENDGQRQKVIFSTKVGLGMDRCLPKEEGGQCYFTKPGTYEVAFKVFDPDGIEWCIPKSMENEPIYQEDIAAGQRCFQGALGKAAINLGDSGYAIHGTKNPASIGQRVSHGCIRVLNEDAIRLYRLLKKGDRVIIAE